MIQLKGPSVAYVALFLACILSGSPALGQDMDGYQMARWDPLHFKPAIDEARDEQCLACHQEVLEDRVLGASPAGVQSSGALAWYQTLDTYAGPQETFHRRHLVSDFAQQVMNLRCNFCHQGNDPREETANSSATGQSDLIQRKHVDPNTCLMCHGKFNYQVMGVPGSWIEHGQLFGDNCLTCHAAIRTNRHQVNFLKPEAIEEAATQAKDVCYGCHGGRSWYRISYPYPRNTWPGDSGTIPDWAKDRPTSSNPRYTVTADAPAAQ
jgi:hypothetical protein